MRIFRRFMTRRDQAEQDLDDEIRFDLSEEARLLIERGAPADDARTKARREFGSVAHVKEETRAVWGWSAAERLMQDLAFAVRALRHNWAYSLTSALTLAVGMGLCTFLFNTLDALMLRPLPGAREPDALVASQNPVSFPYFENYRDLNADVATSVAAYVGPVPFNLGLTTAGSARPERTLGHVVSLEYFSTLGVDPLMGRFFDPGIERRGGDPTVVVSERFWRTRLNADAGALGRELPINGRIATIIGVTQEGFAGLYPISPADIFVPVTAEALVPELAGNVLDTRSARLFRLVLRLAPGTTRAAAEAALDVRTTQLDAASGITPPETERGRPRVTLVPAGTVAQVPTELRSLVTVFMGTLTALILTFTCANLAGLVIAQGSARRREIGLRLALGASRLRVIRQLTVESVLLAGIAGFGALAMTFVFVELLTRSVSSSPLFRLAVQLTPSTSVAAWAGVLCLLTGIGLGFLPAVAATRGDLAGSLRVQTGTTTLAGYRRFGVRNLFVVYQVTAAMTLVVATGFLIAGIQQGADRDVGFDTSVLSLFSIDPLRDGYSPEEAGRLMSTLPQQLIEQAPVAAAALTDPGVFQLFVLPNTTVSVSSAGSAERTAQRVAVQRVGPGFFATLGVPILRGLEFSDRDLRDAGTGVMPAIINHTAADLFGGDDPLGMSLLLDDTTVRIVGVVKYGLAPPFRPAPTPTVVLPLSIDDLRGARPEGLAVLVRAHNGLGIEDARRTMHDIDARLTLFSARTLGDQLADLYSLVGYTTAVYGIVGLFAVVLASVGLAGVTAQAAVRRRKEIGIRMALGARRWQVLSLVGREGVTMTLIGAAIGAAAASGIARALAVVDAQVGQTIETTAGHPLRLLAGPAILLAVASVACFLPARAAATVDPVVALRDE